MRSEGKVTRGEPAQVRSAEVLPAAAAGETLAAPTSHGIGKMKPSEYTALIAAGRG
jgi:hypothetical protein